MDLSTGVPYPADNLIRHKGSDARAQLDGKGLQFALADGRCANVFYASFLEPPSYLEFYSSAPFPAGPTPPNAETAIVFAAEPSGGSSRCQEMRATASW